MTDNYTIITPPRYRIIEGVIVNFAKQKLLDGMKTYWCQYIF